MTKELLKEVATMDLRDQLEAKEQMIKNLKEQLESETIAKNEGEEIVAELKDKIKDLKHKNENLRLSLTTYDLPEVKKVLTEWSSGELDRLLKECGHLIQIEKDFASCQFEKDKLTDLLKRIDEVLK